MALERCAVGSVLACWLFVEVAFPGLCCMPADDALGSLESFALGLAPAHLLFVSWAVLLVIAFGRFAFLVVTLQFVV